jgi:hypothetical protein
MGRLYIIGNGFDLKHNLPSHYSDFADFCHLNYPKLYDQINNLFPTITKDSLWSNFEEGLAEVDSEKLYKDFYECFKDDIRDDKFLKLHVCLNEAFRDWIICLKKLTNVLTPHYIFDQDDCFISFNYTDVLENLYRVNDHHILHIHGYAKTKEVEELWSGYIFGHSKGEISTTESIDSFEYLRADLLNGLKKEYKIADLVETISSWRNEGLNFSEIVVIGHSLNEVDDLYFQKILQLIPDASWIIDYHNCEDFSRKKSNIVRTKIATKNFEFVNF